jgi:hypothetical protein
MPCALVRTVDPSVEDDAVLTTAEEALDWVEAEEELAELEEEPPL